ncbi:MAG: cyclic nucleotide-binding domain-containing protein [Treponema sp.]|nr:cyclic nucleotide-binding domain-containing protein [Treponema sp.]
MALSDKEKKGADFSSILNSVLFSNLLPSEKQFIINHTGFLQIQKGEALFSPNKKADHFYILVEGAIRVYKTQEGGGEAEIALFAPGDTIGDYDFARNAEYDAFAEALDVSLLIVFPGMGFTLEKLIPEAPNVISRILLNCVIMITSRIKNTRKLIFENMSWVQELHRRIHEDPGTGLWKQSFISEERNQILEDPMALIMLKPDRFKHLVDTLGHDEGDRAMIKIAVILKNITRKIGRGWALRIRSNETGILINKCEASKAESLARSLFESIADLTPVPLGAGGEVFSFSGTIAWGVWPLDDSSWDSFYDGIYKLMTDTWKDGGNRVVRYKKGKSA